MQNHGLQRPKWRGVSCIDTAGRSGKVAAGGNMEAVGDLASVESEKFRWNWIE